MFLSRDKNSKKIYSLIRDLVCNRLFSKLLAEFFLLFQIESIMSTTAALKSTASLLGAKPAGASFKSIQRLTVIGSGKCDLRL